MKLNHGIMSFGWAGGVGVVREREEKQRATNKLTGRQLVLTRKELSE